MIAETSLKKFPKVMGILNVTPDSFSDGGDYFSVGKAIRRGVEMLEEGADIIDIGGESTRPGSLPVSGEEELGRVLPVITGIKKHFPAAVISIDTTKHSVADAAIDNGAEIINNVAGTDSNGSLAKLAAEKNCTYIIMHMQGLPRIMQENPVYENVVDDIFYDLYKSIDSAKHYGVKNIVADVGIGFGKTVEHNVELLKNISRFKQLGVPILLGISRKSFIGKILKINEAKDRDIGTLIIHALLLTEDIDIIRVHNVNLLIMLKKLYEIFKKNKKI